MRRRRSSAGDEVTLFPFLAVLICTVGSLIVLLVVMMQQAKATAADRSRERGQQQQAATDEAEQIQLQVEALQWRIEVLHESRQKTIEDLKARETELSYIEDEIRQLRARLDRVAAEAAHIEQLAARDTDEQKSSHAELARLREQIDHAREALDLARRAFNHGERSYALVPYSGANGTRRRPIYIECTSDRVILQPEGVELYSDDFREPMTDDNALAAALRAQREYFADAKRDRQEPPYPLIVVRPDGSHAYAAARAAMEAWDAEFGYELVDDEMKLAFPPVDVALVHVIREAVEEARARRRLLQSIAPARFGRGQPVLTASRRGGFVTQGSGDVGEGPGSERLPARDRSLNDRTLRGETGANDPGSAAGADSFGQAEHSSRGSSNTAPDRSKPTGEWFDGDSLTGGSGSGGLRSSDSDSNGGADGSKPDRVRAASSPTGQVGREQRPAHGQASRSALEGQNISDAHADATSDQAGASSTAGQSAAARAAGAGTNTSAASAGSAIATPGATSGGGMDLSAQPSSAANSRGEDWGLPDRAAGSTAITRPIQLSCYSDHLVIFPEGGQGSRPDVLPVEGPLREEVDQLVSKIWTRIDSWGIAGSRMYWRPVLQVQVQQGADERYAELARLLEGSGIVVTKK
jgi:hypothetical protein